jgi:hypothetical protein
MFDSSSEEGEESVEFAGVGGGGGLFEKEHLDVGLNVLG